MEKVIRQIQLRQIEGPGFKRPPDDLLRACVIEACNWIPLYIPTEGRPDIAGLRDFLTTKSFPPAVVAWCEFCLLNAGAVVAFKATPIPEDVQFYLDELDLIWQRKELRSLFDQAQRQDFDVTNLSSDGHVEPLKQFVVTMRKRLTNDEFKVTVVAETATAAVVAATASTIPTVDDSQVDGGGDVSAYCPATQLYRQRSNEIPNAAAGNRFLKSHPEIRTRKPAQNRLDIHAGDWNAFWSKYDRDRFDATDECAIDAIVEGIEERKSVEQSRKTEKQADASSGLVSLTKKIR